MNWPNIQKQTTQKFGLNRESNESLCILGRFRDIGDHVAAIIISLESIRVQ